MKKVYLRIAILLVLILLLVGCSTDTVIPEVKQPETKEVSQDKIDKPIVDKDKDLVGVKQDSEEKADELGKELRSTKLIEMMKDKNYTLKMISTAKNDGKELFVETTTVVADGQTAVMMSSAGLSMTTILKDDKMYVIMHGQNMILVAPSSERDEEEQGIDEIDFSKIEYIGKGKGTFLGNERDYEEYKVDSGIIKYYFDDKEVDGMELISDEGETVIMDILSYSTDVDMSVFDLPTGYTQIGK